MQNSYDIISERDEVFYVKENATDQVIGKFNNRKDARTLFKRAKSGGVFNGWTPNFFLKKLTIGFKNV